MYRLPAAINRLLYLLGFVKRGKIFLHLLFSYYLKMKQLAQRSKSSTGIYEDP